MDICNEYTRTHIPSQVLFIIGYYGTLNIVPLLYERSLLVIYFISDTVSNDVIYYSSELVG